MIIPQRGSTASIKSAVVTVTAALFNALFAAIGFRLSGAFVDLTYGAHVLHRDALLGFEQPLDPVLPAFPIVTAQNAASHLVLEDRRGGATTSLILTGPHGGSHRPLASIASR